MRGFGFSAHWTGLGLRESPGFTKDSRVQKGDGEKDRPNQKAHGNTAFVNNPKMDNPYPLRQARI